MERAATNGAAATPPLPSLGDVWLLWTAVQAAERGFAKTPSYATAARLQAARRAHNEAAAALRSSFRIVAE